MELNITATAARLQLEEGKDISRHWLGELCRQGRGPKHRFGQERFGKPEILIDWQDALEWADIHFAQKEHDVGVHEIACADDGMMGTHHPAPEPLTADELEEMMIADILAFWVRHHAPNRWTRFMHLHKGQARLDRLNAVTRDMLRLAGKRLASIK